MLQKPIFVISVLFTIKRSNDMIKIVRKPNIHTCKYFIIIKDVTTLNKTIKTLLEHKLVAVIRADSKTQALAIADAIIKGGITAIEITFTVDDAIDVIKALHKLYGDQILLGAGTVLNQETCQLAIENGAKYIVSPGFDQKSLTYCQTNNIPYIPGCLTVTEIMTAKAQEVDLVKLFPGSAFGPKYIKSIHGPLPDIHIMPTGGVTLDNIAEWFHYGASAVGIGSALTHPAKQDDYDKITELTQQFVKKAKV